MNDYSIIINGLTKKFNDFTAVNNISFNVKKGELFGFLGPNGAGKTTTINMLSTLLHPTSGTALINGKNVAKDTNSVRRNIGIVFQEPALDNRLTGRENMEFHAMLYGLTGKSMKKKVNEMLDLVELKDKSDVLVEKYSGGMKRRLEIARGLIHNPNVLFLDEPTLGLDAQTRRHIWNYIKKLNKEKGITMILTTHYMDEADFLCDRIAIIDHGTIIKLDTPLKLKNSLGGDVISIEFKGNNIDKLITSLQKNSWIKKIRHHDGFVDLSLTKAETRIPEIINTANKCKVVISSVNLRKPSLEDVFLHYTGSTIRESESSFFERAMTKPFGRRQM